MQRNIWPPAGAPRAAWLAASGSAAATTAGAAAAIERNSRRLSVMWPPGALHLDDIDELFDGGCRFLERRVFLGRQLDLHDVLDAAGAELHRHADEQIANPVFALQEDRTRQDLLLVP